MSEFPLRTPGGGAFTLAELAGVLGAELVGRTHPHNPESIRILGVSALPSARPDDLGFLADRKYVAHLAASQAGAILVGAHLASEIAEEARPRLVVRNPHLALCRLLDLFFPEVRPLPGIHPTAILSPSVRLGSDVRIGPYAVIEADAELDDGVSVGAHSVVGAGVRLGAGTFLHPHVVLYPGTWVGARVILHAGVRVGVDGFGYVFSGGAHQKVPQVGRCRIEDDVEIGANATVDRGSIGETRIGAGSKLDNLVQVGHNVDLGPRCVLAAQVGVAGSARIGEGVMAGGQVGVSGHLEVGAGARLAGQAGITGDVPAGETVMGMPARPRSEFLRGIASQSRIPALMQRIRKLEAALESLLGERDAES
jgi:UDP-3-O-[3-hydroxymyristoyl] glucosamine N-acyltransferase